MCHKILCVEWEEEDSCLMCGKKDGKCYSCYSDDYSVYERYICKKTFLKCGNDTIRNAKNVKLLIILKLAKVENAILSIIKRSIMNVFITKLKLLK